MSYKHSLLVMPFFLLSCKQEIKKTEPVLQIRLSRKEKREKENLYIKEPSERKSSFTGS
jgi:hypothetical protein